MLILLKTFDYRLRPHNEHLNFAGRYNFALLTKRKYTHILSFFQNRQFHIHIETRSTKSSDGI